MTIKRPVVIELFYVCTSTTEKMKERKGATSKYAIISAEWTDPENLTRRIEMKPKPKMFPTTYMRMNVV